MIRKFYKLSTPVTYEDWERFHQIRKMNFFKDSDYNPYDPKELNLKYKQKVLLYKNLIIGSARLDIVDENILVQAFSIDPVYQKKGHGSYFLKLIERYAKYKKKKKILILATPDSLKFYLKNKYKKSKWGKFPGYFPLEKKL